MTLRHVSRLQEALDILEGVRESTSEDEDLNTFLLVATDQTKQAIKKIETRGNGDRGELTYWAARSGVNVVDLPEVVNMLVCICEVINDRPCTQSAGMYKHDKKEEFDRFVEAIVACDSTRANELLSEVPGIHDRNFTMYIKYVQEYFLQGNLQEVEGN